MTRTALIIGGGIAGPVTAMALQKAGFDAAVYEARPEPADGVGGGFSLAPNGLAALDALDLGDLVRPAGREIAAYVLQDWKGRPLAEFGNPPGVAPMQFFYRSDLHRVLHEEAARRGIRIEYGKRLGAVREETGAITALFEDGTAATADLLVGADGIRSRVRELIDPQAPAPRYAGLISFGAAVSDRGAASTQGRMPMVLGKHAFFGYQVFDDGTAAWFANPPGPIRGVAQAAGGGLCRGPYPRGPADQPHEPGRLAGHWRDGDHAERARVAPGQDGPGGRLRPRPVVKLRPRRLARPGKCGGARPMPARSPSSRGRLRRL
jgi:2-polyprenyl-6-methoxyphenol hydroxylase-like FAD-dependent oxidoreductase